MIKNKYFTLVSMFLVLLVSSCSLFAQVTQEWVSRYNSSGSRWDNASSMVIDGSGNVYVTGETYTVTYSDDEDYLTIKYNSSGVQQWVKTYNGPLNSSDKAVGIAVDNSGNVYVTGSSVGNQYGDLDWVTIKYNSSGIEQWTDRYIPLGGSEPTSIVADASGFVYVSGGINNTVSGNYQFATRKLNSSTGATIWTALEPGDGWKVASMKVDLSGNVYITGPGWLGATYIVDYNYVTIKYNSSGAKQWSSFYNGFGEGSDKSSSLALDNLGNVYVTGYSSDATGNNYDYLTVKYNSSGVQQWASRYSGQSGYGDYAYSIAVDNLGNVYVTGRSFEFSSDYDFVTIKYNSSGVQQWLQRYTGNTSYATDDVAYEVALDAAGNVYVTGSKSGGGGYATIRYSPSGVQQWIMTYRGPGNNSDVAISVKVSTTGKVYVTGMSTGIGTMYDYATIQYSQSVGIKKISDIVPTKYSLSQNYPNPFNPTTKLKFDIARLSDTKIVVYNIMGREVQTLVNESLQPGTYEISFDGSELSSGVYFYRIITNDFVGTKRMSLIK
jgi:uncharacterized delta-60 repeat protein